MKKLMIILILALVPSFVFATTTTATIGGTLKVYSTLSLSDVVEMVWPAQYAGPLAVALPTNQGLAAAPGITGPSTVGQVGQVKVNGTGGTQFTPSLSAFNFTAGPAGLTALNAATSVVICAVSPTGALACPPASVISGQQTLPNPGTAAQSILYYIQGMITAGPTLTAGTYTGTTTFTATYN